MVFEKELEFYRANRDEWLNHYEGKFALIKGEELVGVFDQMREAYEEGTRRFGAQPFLIKKIAKDEPVEQIPAYFLGLSNARLF